MNQELILLPALALVLLTFIVWCRVGIARTGEIRARRIDPQDLATRAGAAATLRDLTASDNFMNLFEMPVLFYFLVTLLYASGLGDRLYLGFAAAYVVLRYAHTLIHLSYNRVMHRFLVYAASSIVLWLMWGRFGWQIVQLFTLNAQV